MSTTSSNRWSLFELSATYYQDSDCNELADPGQELRVTAESNGSGQFLTLSTTRWAVSGPDELRALLADFIGRGAGLPLEQVVVPVPAISPLADTVEPVATRRDYSVGLPEACGRTYLCDYCGHDGGFAFDDCTQPGCNGMYCTQRPSIGPHLAHEYGFGKPAGPYPVEAVDISQVRIPEPVAAPEPEPAPFTHEAINAGQTPVTVVEPSKRGGTSRSGEPLRLWTAAEDEQLKADYATTPNKQLAAVLKRSEKSVILRAGKFGLKKAVAVPAPKAVATPAPAPKLMVKPTPPIVPTAPKPAPVAVEKQPSAGLENKLMKVVDNLGTMPLWKMGEHDAQQALKLLSDNRSALAWVPGAQRLLERLSGHFSMPQGDAMEGSRANA